MLLLAIYLLLFSSLSLSTKYSLRGGVPTAISHGLWLFTPDYDAPTQLLKPKERNTNYLDMAQTIPHRVFYPMCSMNVAFSRELIGPAFMQGLMGDGQPWARYAYAKSICVCHRVSCLN